VSSKHLTWEHVYKAITHILLGIIFFMVKEIYSTAKSAMKQIQSHETRISILEKSFE